MDNLAPERLNQSGF